jgi:hypothetical protein
MEYNLDLENCVRQFLGDKAYGTAGRFGNSKQIKKYLLKCLDVCSQEVLTLDTTARHKEMLLNNINKVKESIQIVEFVNEEDIKLVLNLFWLISRLFGFDWVSGQIRNKAFYYQDYGAYFHDLVKEKAFKDEKFSQYDFRENIKKNIITKQREIYNQLKKGKFSDQEIAQVFNTTEYHIKKLKNDI